MSVFLLFTVFLFFAFTESSKLSFYGRRSSAPKGWIKLDRAPESHNITFIIALKQQNLNVLEKVYEDRTNPDSANYRNWMTIEQINKIVAPPIAVQNSVKNWLVKSGISNIISYGDAIEATGSVIQLENLFKCEFHVFRHRKLGKVVSVWGDYFVPQEHHRFIEMISGINSFPSPSVSTVKQSKNHKRNEEGIWDADTYIVPATLYNMYKIPSNARVTNPNVSQAVIEWEQQYFSTQDLSAFATNMGANFITNPIVVGMNDQSNPGVESTLDIQWIAATGIGAQNWFWIENSTTWLYGFAVHFLNTNKVPMVCSMSYGWNEEMQCEQGIGSYECNEMGVNSTVYVSRVNTEFMKIGLRGVSLMSASGDSGANGRTDESCSDSVFHPPYPAASPYVTAVGATQIFDALFNLPTPPPVCANGGFESFWWCGRGGHEVAVSYEQAGFASGGGFSNVAPMPTWQRTAVQNFLNSSTGKQTPVSYFNPSGRAFPDMAAMGSNLLIWSAGTFSPVGGTSASCPISAGIFSLLNDYVVTKTGKALGPLNPLIYKMAVEHPAAFTDITVGDNTCTESGCSGCQGFYCGPGWDPVTGWGTPVYSEMLAYIKSIIN